MSTKSIFHFGAVRLMVSAFVVASSFSVGCYKSLDPREIHCTPGESGSCPDGYECKANFCALKTGAGGAMAPSDGAVADVLGIPTNDALGTPGRDSMVDGNADSGGTGESVDVATTGGVVTSGGVVASGGAVTAGGVVATGGVFATGGAGGIVDAGLPDSPGLDVRDVPMGGGGATGGAGGVPVTGGVPATGGTIADPVISTFVATPTTITAGKNTTLSWSLPTAATVTIDQGIGLMTGSLSRVVAPTTTTTYTLTAQNTAGKSVTAQTTVTVVPASTIASFTAALTPIASGASTTLTAAFSNGAGTIDQGKGVITSGTAISTGVLSTSTTYTLTVTNPAGDSVTAKVTVTVASPGTFAGITTLTPRQRHTATLLANGKVLIVGGNNSGPTTNTAELYNPITQTFVATGAMATQRECHTATLLTNGKVLITGGQIGNSPYHSSAELYDPATGAFTPTGSMTTARSWHTATLLADGTVLVVAGSNGVGDLRSAELYNPATGTFRAISNVMMNTRIGHSAFLLPTTQKVLIVAGNGAQSIEFYDPVSESFASVGSMTIARSYPTATLLPNNKVLISGGWAADAVLGSTEVYDPTSKTSALTGALPEVREFHTSTLLDNGQVLVVGGQNQTSFLTSAELYDPAAGTWKTTGAPNTGREQHTATALPDRKVLIVGGNGQPPGAELYFY